MLSSSVLLLLAAGSAVVAQSNGCQPGYEFGTDTVLFTTPYTYAQVMSIIGSYKNLTWSGNPDDTVTLDGPDNTVNTTRTYMNSGALVIERILNYSKPVSGPYVEVHTLAPLTIPAANLSFYSDYDYTSVTSICDGRASTFNLTAPLCATNATLAASVLHGIHLTDAQTVGVFLGGANFTSCEALGSVGGNATATKTGSGMGPTPTIVTANEGVGLRSGMAVLVGGLMMALGMGL